MYIITRYQSLLGYMSLNHHNPDKQTADISLCSNYSIAFSWWTFNCCPVSSSLPLLRTVIALYNYHWWTHNTHTHILDGVPIQNTFLPRLRANDDVILKTLLKPREAMSSLWGSLGRYHLLRSHTKGFSSTWIYILNISSWIWRGWNCHAWERFILWQAVSRNSEWKLVFWVMLRLS